MRFFAVLAVSFLLVSCGAPTPDVGSTNGKEQILDEVNIDLTNGDCDDALTAITPLYSSAQSDNDVREAMASVYGCKANINFFGLVGQLTTDANTLQNGLFSYLAKLFPSTQGKDYVVEGSLLATDALQASLSPGALVLPANQVNPGTYNVGSTIYTDRVDEANFYEIFIAMAGVGGLENRSGLVNPANYQKTAAMPWTTAAGMTSDGCEYASSVMNLIDAFHASSSYLPAAVGTAINTLLNGQAPVPGLLTALDQACSYGCAGGVPTAPELAQMGIVGGWVDTGCSAATVSPCAACPNGLRDRSQCTASNANQVACAAAGVINFMNNSVAGWQ